MTADSEIWNAFGSDSDSSTDDDDEEEGKTSTVEDVTNTNNTSCSELVVSSLLAATDAALLQITSHFVRNSSFSGVSITDRVVGVEIDINDDDDDNRLSTLEDQEDYGVPKEKYYHHLIAERVHGRGMKTLNLTQVQEDNINITTSCCFCDAAVLVRREHSNNNRPNKRSVSICKTRTLLPGGSLWIIIVALDEKDNGDHNRISKIIEREYPTTIWSVLPSLTKQELFSSSNIQVVHLQKHSCVINAWSCPWMNKKMHPPNRTLISTFNKTEEYYPIRDDENENYLQYERRLACALTIVPSVKERRQCWNTTNLKKDANQFSTILTDKHIQHASDLLRRHGLVIIKGLLPQSQTIRWGEAVLTDFSSAVSRLRSHPTRPVDLLNPHNSLVGSSNSDDSKVILFGEPINYMEMAMREDLRVDLRSGPEMEKLRNEENQLAVCSMKIENDMQSIPSPDLGTNNGPTMIHANVIGTVDSWRFHPSLLAIIKRVFNPQKESFSKGNFGRWNFGGSGPDGSPQPFRLGQIGSVISCPGSADQAIHADTPHLFEHEDCLPCHYLNVFTPGYQVNDIPNDGCIQHEFFDGIWTGNSTMGGTALVYGSHKLSVTAQLFSDENDTKNDTMDDGAIRSSSESMRKKMLWLRILRPSLEAGDVLIFDCRTIHFGLANTSRGDQSGQEVNAGRRPMLYTNVSQSWFHDPKNWDDREKIFY